MSRPNFLKIPYRTWWIFYFCAQSILIILMSSTFSAKTWVYSNNRYTYYNPEIPDSPSESYYDGEDFSGDLYFCRNGCTESYGWLAKNWCKYYNDEKKNLDSLGMDESSANPLLSICASYLSLYIGTFVYALFEILSIVSVLSWGLGMVCYCKKMNCLWLTFCCASCSCVFHYIALIGYLSIVKGSFSDSCNVFPNNGQRPNLCVADGPKLSLAVLIFIPILAVFYCVVACKLQRNFGYGGLAKDAGDNSPQVVNPVANFQAFNYQGIYNQPVYPVAMIVGEANVMEYNNIPAVCLPGNANNFHMQGTESVPPDRKAEENNS